MTQKTPDSTYSCTYTAVFHFVPLLHLVHLVVFHKCLHKVFGAWSGGVLAASVWQSSLRGRGGDGRCESDFLNLPCPSHGNRRSVSNANVNKPQTHAQVSAEGQPVTGTHLVLSLRSAWVEQVGCCSSSYLQDGWRSGASPSSRGSESCWKRCLAGRRRRAAPSSVFSAPPRAAELLGSPPRSSTTSAVSWSAGGRGRWRAPPRGLVTLKPCSSAPPLQNTCWSS